MEIDGARLREARLRRMLTLRELAEQTGVGFDTISRIETGNQRPRISTLRKLAAALEVDPETLIEWDRTTPETGKAAA